MQSWMVKRGSIFIGLLLLHCNYVICGLNKIVKFAINSACVEFSLTKQFSKYTH